MSETATFRLRVNGTERVVEGAWLGESLLYVLRERLGLPGAKNACEQGECGSCSVLLDGTLVCSCLVLAASAAEQEMVTVEGLPNGDGELTDVQQAFVDEGAVQCGFCTPGLVSSRSTTCSSATQHRRTSSCARRSPATCAAAPGTAASWPLPRRSSPSGPARAAQRETPA